MNTRVLTAHVPVDLAEKIDERAMLLDRPRGWIVKQALTAWIEDEEERDRLTREAMAQADARQTIPHDRVRAWARSLATDDTLAAPKP